MEKDKVKIAQSNRHFLLYAKNHYKSTTIIEDLKTIQGHWSGVDRELITICNVYEHQVNLLADLCGEQALRNVLLDLWKWKSINTEISVEHILQKIDAYLAQIKVKERSDGLILELGEPDYNILPKPEYNKI